VNGPFLGGTVWCCCSVETPSAGSPSISSEHRCPQSSGHVLVHDRISGSQRSEVCESKRIGNAGAQLESCAASRTVLLL